MYDFNCDLAKPSLSLDYEWVVGFYMDVPIT